jgi:hypothetical protein
MIWAIFGLGAGFAPALSSVLQAAKNSTKTTIVTEVSVLT